VVQFEFVRCEDLLHDRTLAGRMRAIMPSPSDSFAPAVSSAPRGFCKGCGYALVGLESRVCPECGRGFDPGNRRTFATRPARGWVWRWGRRVLAVVLLLVLTAGAGVGWLWWGWHAEQPTIARLRALHQQFTVAPIGPERLRWVLGERWSYLAERVDAVYLEGLKAADFEPLDLRHLSRIQMLRLYHCEVSNSTLSRLVRLKRLQNLSLMDIKIQQPDLAFLEELPVLSSLGLAGGWVDQAGLKHVGRLKNLKLLNLDVDGMKDADLQPLQGLSSLKQLALRGNPISDAGLAHLQGLKSLRVLLMNRRLHDSRGVAKLKETIPGLQILPW